MAGVAVAAAALLAPSLAAALPMGSVATWMVMGDFNAGSRELAANHALTGRDAIGAAAARWSEGHRRRETAALTYTRLVQRWNLPHAQANLWLVAQAGHSRADSGGPGEGGRPGRQRGGFGALALLADYETTRVYAGGDLRPLRGAQGLRQDTAWLRTGLSFYEAEYDQTQPWFVPEARRQRGTFERKALATPMLRLIDRRYFVELGANRDGGVFNFMLNY